MSVCIDDVSGIGHADAVRLASMWITRAADRLPHAGDLASLAGRLRWTAQLAEDDGLQAWESSMALRDAHLALMAHTKASDAVRGPTTPGCGHEACRVHAAHRLAIAMFAAWQIVDDAQPALREVRLNRVAVYSAGAIRWAAADPAAADADESAELAQHAADLECIRGDVAAA